MYKLTHIFGLCKGSGAVFDEQMRFYVYNFVSKSGLINFTSPL